MAKTIKPVVSSAFEIMANSALAESSRLQTSLVPVDVVDTTEIAKAVKLFVDGEALQEQGKEKLKFSAQTMCEVMGTNPTFDHWSISSNAWKLSYKAAKPKITDNAVDKAWSRQADVMSKEFGLDKPKAPGKAAKGMSEKRAAEKARLESLVDSQLHEAIAGFAQVGNFREATKYQDEINRRAKLAGEDQKVQLKLEKKLISRCIWKITDADRIAQIRALIPNAVYDEVRSEYEANLAKGASVQ